MLRYRRLLAALALALLPAGCAQNPVTGNPNFVMMSEAEEVRIGQQEDANVRKQYGIYRHPALQAYVEGIGQALARASHRPNLEWKFTVVDSAQINAFALPGGYIYITRGILAYLNSEAELAAVLGHEIGHVTARHSVQQVSAATAANIGATVASIFVPELRTQAGNLLVNVLGGSLLAGYGREHELEADRLGAEYLARTGYNPQAMIKVIGVLKNQELLDAELAKAEGREPRRYHGVFATHPDNDTRLKEVVAEAAKVQAKGAVENPETFLRTLDRTVYGDSEEQGIVRQGNFYHPQMGLAMSFPTGWRVTNSPERVAARSPSNDAALELRHAGKAQGTPADVLRRQLRLGFGAQVAPTEFNGLPAAVTTQSMQGRPTRAAVVFLNGNAYLLGAQAASPQAMNRHARDLDAAMRSFHPITDAERALARPLAIRVVTAGPGMTYAQLAQRSPLGRFAESRLRALNGHYPSGEPTPGQALKIVE